jgi:hypothetical protein
VSTTIYINGTLWEPTTESDRVAYAEWIEAQSRKESQ